MSFSRRFFRPLSIQIVMPIGAPPAAPVSPITLLRSFFPFACFFFFPYENMFFLVFLMSLRLSFPFVPLQPFFLTKCTVTPDLWKTFIFLDLSALRRAFVAHDAPVQWVGFLGLYFPLLRIGNCRAFISSISSLPFSYRGWWPPPPLQTSQDPCLIQARNQRS